MGTAFVFPGQGSQYIGMGKPLYQASPSCRAVFQEVDEAIDFPLSRLMFEGDIAELTLTENVQPALMAVSMAVLSLLNERLGKPVIGEAAQAVAGHSLGEYTALTAAGALGITQSAELLRARGQAMQKAVPAGEGVMLAILGLDVEQVQQLVDRMAGQHPDLVCDLANDNAPGQAVLSGHAAISEPVIALARQMGAKRALPLPVSAPFHCRLMGYARDVMQERLADCKIATPTVPVYANVDTQPTTDEEKIRQNLVDQVCGRVRWRESIAVMASDGYERFVEVGAGKVLSGLVARIDKGLARENLQEADEISAFIERL